MMVVFVFLFLSHIHVLSLLRKRPEPSETDVFAAFFFSFHSTASRFFSAPLQFAVLLPECFVTSLKVYLHVRHAAIRERFPRGSPALLHAAVVCARTRAENTHSVRVNYHWNGDVFCLFFLLPGRRGSWTSPAASHLVRSGIAQKKPKPNVS